MANRTPLTSQVATRLVDVQVMVRRLAGRDGLICDEESRLLSTLRDVAMTAEEADQARVEAIYALNVGLEEGPSAWHRRKRRELGQLKRDDAGRESRPTS